MMLTNHMRTIWLFLPAAFSSTTRKWPKSYMEHSFLVIALYVALEVRMSCTTHMLNNNQTELDREELVGTPLRSAMIKVRNNILFTSE